MSVKKQPISLSVKPRGKAAIDDDAVESFANQAETETQKITQQNKIASTSTTSRAGKKKNKPAASKVKRDSFTMPEDDYELIHKLINKLMKAGMLMNKGEILRAGLKALNDMSVKELKDVCDQVERIKTGRPPE
tara:strand:- start:2794 stop:3195 length:402 start_codon:yes stop_codon:yes gene_type:complete